MADLDRAGPGKAYGQGGWKQGQDLDAYGTFNISSDRHGQDGDEADSNASSPPLPHRQRSLDRWGNVGDSGRRGSPGTDFSAADNVMWHGVGPMTPGIVTHDAHFTPGTLLREHANDGYSKTRTRPTGQGAGRDSGAPQATMGTRGVEVEGGGPFSRDAHERA
jgi:hypothetical protein